MKPIVYEQTGVDQNGNRYYIQDVIASTDYKNDIDSIKNLIESSLGFDDYIEVPQSLMKNDQLSLALDEALGRNMFATPMVQSAYQTPYIPAQVQLLRPQSAVNYFPWPISQRKQPGLKFNLVNTDSSSQSNEESSTAPTTTTVIDLISTTDSTNSEDSLNIDTTAEALVKEHKKIGNKYFFFKYFY